MARINIKTILLLILANTLITIILPILSSAIAKSLNKKFEIGLFNLPAIYSLIIVILIIILLKIYSKSKTSFYGIKKLNIKDIKLTFLLLFFLFPIPLLGRILDPSFDSWYTSQYNIFSFLAILYFLINLPIFIIKEELIERSLIQNHLSKYYSSLITILVVSINFAILHFFLIPNSYYHSFITLASVFLGSLIIVSLYEITKNVFLTMIIHIIYNLTVFYQIILHINNNLLGEIILFTIWGLLFLFTFKKSFNLIKPLFISKKQKLSTADYSFLIFYAILLPIIILIITKYL
ncbi:CPBP family intramembrane metalloprotease [Candidatus Woesearchaeota archaeon]|nr:CPBP family intramembrane metalloprotease [Candidatus Woesearchaeota archaeon]